MVLTTLKTRIHEMGKGTFEEWKFVPPFTIHSSEHQSGAEQSEKY